MNDLPGSPTHLHFVFGKHNQYKRLLWNSKKAKYKKYRARELEEMKVINVVLLKLGVTVDYKNQFVFVRV